MSLSMSLPHVNSTVVSRTIHQGVCRQPDVVLVVARHAIRVGVPEAQDCVRPGINDHDLDATGG
jgi:hypothetical protein